MHNVSAAAAIAACLVASGPLFAADESRPASSPPFMLDLPAQCTVGENCWVVNYVDVDPGPLAKDLHCEARTYQGHDGTDLAIRDRASMEEGLAVLAAATGTVRRVRDGIADLGLSDAQSRDAVAGRECGNGVVIEHGDGWETQYCHLKQHSLRVRSGQAIEHGTPLGLIGLSGKTEFPHVHLTVRHHGVVIDPFTGLPNDAGCGRPGQSLWRDPRVAYEDVALYSAGFSGTEPKAEDIRRGGSDRTTMPADAPALVLWVDMFGVKAEDRLRFRITAPDGRILVDQTQRVERTQARRFAFAGRRRQGPSWPAGPYEGEILLQRGDDGSGLTRSVRVRTMIH